MFVCLGSIIPLDIMEVTSKDRTMATAAPTTAAAAATKDGDSSTFVTHKVIAATKTDT